MEPVLIAAVRGHKSMYATGTLASLKPGEKGLLETADAGLVFTPGHGASAVTIPYDTISAMDYGEHAGRRVGSAIALGVMTDGVGALILLSKKKRHYLTFYINNNPKLAAEERVRLAKDPGAVAKGDVAAFEINKHDYDDMISILQAKTGVAVHK